MCHRTVGRFCKWVSTSASWSCTRTSFPFQTVKAREFSSDVLISQRCRCGVGTTRSILLVHGDCMGSTCMFQSTCQRFWQVLCGNHQQYSFVAWRQWVAAVCFTPLADDINWGVLLLGFGLELTLCKFSFPWALPLLCLLWWPSEHEFTDRAARGFRVAAPRTGEWLRLFLGDGWPSCSISL